MPEFLTAKEVAAMLKVSARRIPVLLRAGRIPLPIVYGERTRRWRASDFEAKEAAPMKERKPKRNAWDAALGL